MDVVYELLATDVIFKVFSCCCEASGKSLECVKREGDSRVGGETCHVHCSFCDFTVVTLDEG